ncbi:hypothetical protein AX17_005020 [Amanita inopinata Kibby_2008]|nr:hypothetical protein AX17_005020 [Amanita inopinata Kibby_2008]
MSSDSPFPQIDPAYILSFQFSSWYPTFSDLSIKSKIIRPLSQNFQYYLDADGIFVPEGSDNVPFESELSDEEESHSEGDIDSGPKFTFPELDEEIRKCIKEYGAVFPKLNFSSPKDASWVLPASSPLKCTSPADVYMLLKSSDFITHDLNAESVFEGCRPSISEMAPPYELELILRKWYPVDSSREFRCFVRENQLLGITQRDINYYEFLNEPRTKDTITSTIMSYWQTNIKTRWKLCRDYVFDILLTRDLSHGHIVDFNPYTPGTDALLFTYEDLQSLLKADRKTPMLRTIDSRSHPATIKNAPANQHNMIPFDALMLSSGTEIDTFTGLWKQSIENSMRGDDSD